MAHLVDGVHVADVVLGRELVDVALKVLGRELVEGAHVRPSQRSPERFDAVGVRPSLDVLAHRMVHRLVVALGDVAVGGGFVGENRDALLGLLLDDAVQRLPVDGSDDLGMDVAGLPVLDADHGNLACRAPSGVEPHVEMLRAFEPAHVNFVGFHRPGEPALGLEGFADAVRHEPSGFLVDAEFAVQPHRGNALEADGVQVDGVGPILECDLGSVHGRPGADGEILPAVPAAVGHRLARLALDGVERTQCGQNRPSSQTMDSNHCSAARSSGNIPKISRVVIPSRSCLPGAFCVISIRLEKCLTTGCKYG